MCTYRWNTSKIALLTCAAALVLTFAASPVAFAQDGVVKDDSYGAEVKKPEGWDKADGNEKAIAVFTHSGTQSQIEVVPTKLMTADVAQVFFDTFYNTLKESNFERDKQEDKTYGEHKGKETTYNFTHSGVTLRVHVFSFVRGTTAWLVVGYWQKDEEGSVSPAFASTINDLKITQ